MALPTCRDNTPSMSGPTTFSYAQAAKGRAAAQPNTQSTTAPPQADSHSKDDASSVTTGPDAAVNTFSTASDVSESAKSSQIDADVIGPRKTSDTATAVNGTAAALKDDTANAPRVGTETSAPAATEKPARQSNRSSEPADPKKGRKGRKGKSSDKEAEVEQAAAEPEKEVIPVKLYEAPPPSVNIWEQRAAAAKAKQPSTPSQAPPAASADSTAKSRLETTTKIDSSNGVPSSETAARGTTKTAETSRPTIDSSARRNPRGSRMGGKGEVSPKVPSSAVENVSLWPTPETAAAEDGKRKTASEPDKEKEEDGSKTTGKKRDWKKIEITPSVVFNTPLPQQRTMNKGRGGGNTGRGSGGRGHASSVSMSGEKAQGGGPDATSSKDGAEVQGRSREDTQPRTTSAPSEKLKRFPVDQQNQRKPSVPSVNRGTAEYSASKNEAPKAVKDDSASFTPRGEGQDAVRKEGGFASHKESKPRRGAHGNGRGGHNGQQAFVSNGHGSRANTYSPPNFTSPGFPPSSYGGSRGGRGRPVSMSNGNGVKGSSASRMHGHPHSASHDYSHYHSYSHAPPYSPQPAYSPDYYLTLLHSALKKQIEYYFSDVNLEKDSFLKAHMDAQGFVPFEIIANFPRIKSMSNQTSEFVRVACADCKDVDYVLAEGQRELVRCRMNWQRWISEGDGQQQDNESARSPGPSTFVYRSLHSLHLNPNFYQQQPIPYQPYNPMSPQGYGPGPAFSGDMYPGYMNGPPFPPAVNGAQVNGHNAADSSPLNASVPEFSPITALTGLPMANAFSHLNWEDQTLQSAQIFTDEEVASLHMVAQGKLSNGVSGASTGSKDSTAPKTPKTNGVPVELESLTT